MPDSDIQLYVNSMARVRERINFVQTVNVNQINIPSNAFKGELMFLQFRKVLEEIAFSTIAAHKDVTPHSMPIFLSTGRPRPSWRKSRRSMSTSTPFRCRRLFQRATTIILNSSLTGT